MRSHGASATCTHVLRMISRSMLTRQMHGMPTSKYSVAHKVAGLRIMMACCDRNAQRSQKEVAMPPAKAARNMSIVKIPL